MGGIDARTAVGDDVGAFIDAHLGEQLSQLAGRPEIPVGVEVGGGRCVAGAGNVAGTRIHRFHLTPIPFGRTDIQQYRRRVGDLVDVGDRQLPGTQGDRARARDAAVALRGS